MNTLGYYSRSLLVGLVGLWVVGLMARAQAPKPDFAALEAEVQTGLKRSQTPGCAVAVVLGEEIIFAKGFGVANVDTGDPVRVDMLFRLGSTTKMFTAATVVSLAEEGRVKLDAPIETYIKGLNPKLAGLTTHQLLSHQAGLADETRMEGPHEESALGEGVRAMPESLVFTEPGRIWSYSNPGYRIAGLVAQEAGGKPFADLVAERVLKPCGMVRSAFRPTEAMTWPLAVGHGPEGSGAPSVVRPLAENAAGWPSGSLFSSAPEFARFCIVFMNGGKIDGKQALSPYVIEKLSTPYVAVPGSNGHYGYGLSVRDQDGLRWLSHSGNRSGYGSYMRMCPEKKFAVIILCNKTGVGLPNVADKAAELVLGIPPPPREPRQEWPITAEEAVRFAGTYSNGRTTIPLVARDGKLMAPRGEVKRIGENRFRFPVGDSPAAEFLLIAGKDGRIEFLVREGRALARVAGTAN